MRRLSIMKGSPVKKYLLAALAGVILSMGIVLPAHATQPDFICEPLDSGKIDTIGDPATVTVTAPDGFLIDGYCVKAGTTKYFIVVDPPTATVIVDHPDKDSVSHYSLSYVAIQPCETDCEPECEDGEVLENGVCVEPPCETDCPTPTPEPTCEPGEELQPTDDGYVCGPADNPTPDPTPTDPPAECGTPTTLACTGVSDQQAIGLIVGGICFLLLGGTLLRLRRI